MCSHETNVLFITSRFSEGVSLIISAFLHLVSRTKTQVIRSLLQELLFENRKTETATKVT